MGTDMRAHLEYREGEQWNSLSNWQLIRGSHMYRLLANVRGEGAIFPPRGLPYDAGEDTRRAYLQRVVETEDEVRRLEGRVNAISRTGAEQAVARGSSEWFDFHGHQFINFPEFHHTSWLTAAEFCHVIDYYRTHIPTIRVRDHEANLTRLIDLYGEEKGRHLAGTLWQPPEEPYDFVHVEFRMLLAAIEAGEATGFQVRLIFWFHG